MCNASGHRKVCYSMKYKNSKNICHVSAFLVSVVWGSTFIFTKQLLLNGLSSAHIFTLRFVIAYILLAAYSFLCKHHRWMADSWRDELRMLALGVTGGSLYFLAENEAMNYTTTTNTSLIVCSCPLVTTLLVSVFYRELRPRGWQVVGMLMAVIGMAIVVLNGRFVLHLSPLGDMLALVACLCWAVYSLLMIPANNRYDAVFITRKVFFYGLVTILPYYLLVPGFPPLEVLTRPQVVGNLLFLGFFASMLCFLVWAWVLKRLGTVVATNYVYLNPLSTIFFAWWLLSEQITACFLLGAVLIVIGMFLADRKR